MGATTTTASEAAHALHDALRASERGANLDGPYWNTKALVAALRAFYEAMGGTAP